AQRVLDNLENKRKLETKILKQVGILIQMPAKKSAMHDVAAIKYSNLSLRFDLENLPVLWLGESNDAESIALLQKIYTASDSSILKARAVSAIGLHDSDDLVMPHLREFALHGEASKIRKEAIYRLSQRNNDQVLPILEKAAFNDKQHAVQKEAVYRISNKKSAQSFAILKKIATTHKVRSLRKEAIYRISLRKNTPQTSEFLLEIVFNDPDRSLQKEALYRLTLLRPEQSTQLLIKIAETHATASIRKEAIYRLGRKKHPKAKKVFIELLEER
ncbi:MAG: HEAT repeat domain-containing protein, partial [bacterium]